MFTFVRNCQIVFQSDTFCIPTSSKWGFLFFCILTSIWYCQFLDFSHFNKDVVVSHHWFNLQFSNDILCWVSFHMLVYHLCIFFILSYAQIFCPSLFFNLFLFNIFFNWRKIALQCCVGFCCTITRISHSCIYISFLLNLSPTPSHHFRSSQSTRLASLCYIATSL